MANIVVKVHCKHNDRGSWCTNKKIKRSLWGFGARLCVDYGPEQKCPYREWKIKVPASG